MPSIALFDGTKEENKMKKKIALENLEETEASMEKKKKKESKLKAADTEEENNSEKRKSKKKESKKRKVSESEDEEEKSETSSELGEPVNLKAEKKKKKKARVDDEVDEQESSENPNAVSRFRISEPLKAKLKSKGIESLFPIQAMTFGMILDGSDLVGRARTGQVY